MKLNNSSLLIAIVSLLLSSTGMAQNYCAGIRGNGELAPAHWGALARIVENKGLPSTVAGGSSAAITMFLLDALSRNPNLSKIPEQRNIQLSLLIKSFVPHITYLYQIDAKSPAVMTIVGNITGMGDGGFIHKLKSSARIAKNVPALLKALGRYRELLNPALLKGLRRNFSFYKGQIVEGLNALGAFDAENDMNLFYREGVVDFKFFGLVLGRVADFYAGFGDSKTNVKLNQFIDQCTDNSKGKLWSTLTEETPHCKTLLYSAFDRYYKKRNFPNKMIFSKVGSGLNAFPTTSLVVGNGERKYSALLRQYEKKEAKGVEDYSLNFDSDLKYGYWGRSAELDKLSYNLAVLFPSDIKSSKFTPLKGGSWFEVLGTSPAEPGLANLQRIPDGNRLTDKKGNLRYRSGMYSAGGWSDLHPTLVLKASGCEDIVYITRQGGESVFGQQIFIRLTGYTDKIRFWRDIKAQNRVGWSNLTPEEENSPWNRLYNLANPSSSYNLSVKTANAVYCTDWDRYYIFEGQVSETMIDAFTAPLFLKDEAQRSKYNFGIDSEGRSEDNFPGCL